MSTEFFASTLGGTELRVLARFTTDEHGLHIERLDRHHGRWLADSTVAGYLTGHDDWAQRITRNDAARLLKTWGLDAAILDAPVVEPAGR